MKFKKPILESEKFSAADIIAASIDETDPTIATTNPDSTDPYESDKF